MMRRSPCRSAVVVANCCHSRKTTLEAISNEEGKSTVQKTYSDHCFNLGVKAPNGNGLLLLLHSAMLQVTP